MRSLHARIAALSILVGWLMLTPPVVGQQPAKPAAQESGHHGLVIYNGSHRTVHYFTTSESPGEQASLRDLGRAENEAALADELMALRRQYVYDERQLEARRAEVQRLYYGYSTEIPTGFYGRAGLGYYGGFGYSGFGFPGYGLTPGTASYSLAYGVGDEGIIKRELAQTLAVQATPEYAAQAYRQLSASAGRVGGPSGRVTPAADELASGQDFRLAKRGARVIVNYKSGDAAGKVEGSVVAENGDWLIVDTKDGRRTIARGQIIDVLEPK